MLFVKNMIQLQYFIFFQWCDFYMDNSWRITYVYYEDITQKVFDKFGKMILLLL